MGKLAFILSLVQMNGHSSQTTATDALKMKFVLKFKGLLFPSSPTIKFAALC